MGFKTNHKCKAKCPLYEDIIRTNNGLIAGVQCSFLCNNFGFDASTIVRCRNYSEVMDMKELFCDDCFEGCPYYQAWQWAQNPERK